LSTGYCCGI